MTPSLISILSVVSVILWVSAAGTQQVAPPRPGLVAVHFPDLSRLEADVSNQIKSQQEMLVALARDANAGEMTLSAAYGALGELYHAYAFNAPARECYLNASSLTPKDFRWLYLLAKLDQTEGRVDDAIKRFSTVASLQPEFVAVLVNLGNIYLELNRLADAKNSFAAALEKQAANAAAHYGLGQVALSQRSYAEAVSHFEKALALAPEANRIHYALAMAWRGAGNIEKAKYHLAQQGPVGVRVADPLMDQLQDLVKGARVYLIRGRQALEARRFQEAASEFRKALDARPDSVPAHVNLGATLTQLGDLHGAAEQFRQALRFDSNNLTAHFNLAVLLANEKQHDQAIVHLQKVSLLNPHDFGARFFLVQQLLVAARAAEALEVARSLYSTTGSLQHGELVAVALAQLGRCGEAVEWQRKLIAAAIEQGNSALETKLRADLSRYQNGELCRPEQNPSRR